MANSPSGWVRGLQAAWRRRGPLACALLPLATVYGWVTAVRRGLYRSGWRASETVGVPVVVVGNLIAGGAGKTPTVMAVVALLRRHGYRPGIISRGYGGAYTGWMEVTPESPASRCGDEPLLMHLRTGAPLVVCRDRVTAARQLIARHPHTDVIVSDDGLQHLRLARDAQVIVFDDRGAGNGWLLPAGPLREPLPRRVPPRSLLVYNASRATTPLPGSVAARRLQGVVALDDWWSGTAASWEALDRLRGRPLLAVAGLAAPERFFDMLRAARLEFEARTLPDHHDYASLAWPETTADVILTEKDAVKLLPASGGGTRVWVAPLDFTLDAAFATALLDLIPPPGTRHGNSPA